MSRANDLWGAPHIHGELLKLGFTIARRTLYVPGLAAIAGLADLSDQSCRWYRGNRSLRDADVYVPGIIMNRGFIARWTRMPHSIGLLSASAPSHHSLSSAAFITNIAESDFRHAQRRF
jgi:hypothetical protein